MNKFLMTVAILTFFSINLYAQQTQQPKEKTEYSYNEDKTTAAKVCTKYYDDGKVETVTTTTYGYYDGVVSNEKTLKISYDKSGAETTKTTTVLMYANGAKAKETFEEKRLIAGVLRITVEKSEGKGTTPQVTMFDYDAAGNMTTAKYFDYSYESSNRVLDSITIITYLPKKAATSPDVIERTTMYVLTTDDNGLLTVDISVKDKKSVLLESRSIMFTSDLSFNDLIWYKGPRINKSEAQAEAQLIEELISEGNHL